VTASYLSQADIRNPLCYLLITLLAATAAYVSEGACTPPDTSKSPPLIALRNRSGGLP